MEAVLPEGQLLVLVEDEADSSRIVPVRIFQRRRGVELVLGALDEDAAVGERDGQAADIDVLENFLVSDVFVKNDVFIVNPEIPRSKILAWMKPRSLVILLVLLMSRLLLEPLLLVQSFLNGSGVLKLFLVHFNHSWDTRLALILSPQLTSIRLLKGIIEDLALNHSRLEWVESRLWL